MIILPSLQDVRAVALLRDGGVGVIPTDTIYGLAASAHNLQAVARLYRLKDRERKPGTVIAANVQQLLELGVDKDHLNKVARLWPNSLSVETPLSEALSYLHQGTGRQGFRVVADEALRKFLEQTGPLVTSSANHPGAPVANNLAGAQAYFDDRVDFYVDGGDLSDRPPSTLVRITEDGHVEVLRQGAVAINEKGEIA